MAKSKKIDVNSLSSVVMPMQLDACTPSEYADVLEMLLHDEDVQKIIDHRQRMFNVADRPGANVYAIRKGIEADDKKIAMLILLAMMHRTMRAAEKEYTNINDLWKQIPADDKEKQAVKVRCSFRLDMVVFLADIIESKLVDIKRDLDTLFPDGHYNWEQFDGVKASLHQLSSAFHLTRDVGSEAAQELFCTYADSMEKYFDMRMRTYHRELAKIYRKDGKDE